jgi:RNA polymerase sigma-54 factor
MQVLAPQLRQSLELLQVPVLELRTLVQQEIEQNPTLEEAATLDAPSPEPEAPAAEGETPAEPTASAEAEAPPAEEKKEDDFKDEFDKLVQLDDEWRDYFQQDRSSQPYTSDDAARRQFFLDSLSQPKSLQQHLMDQLTLSVENETDRQIGELLIGSINDDGFLTSTIEDLASTTGFTVDQVHHVLTSIQEFDPIGVGAKDLRECLLIQLRRLGKEDSLPATIVRDHLDAAGSRKYPDIARALKVSVDQVQDAARFIGTLEPKPGRLFVADAPAYVLPEVSVQKIDGEYVVFLNNDQIPRLHISAQYRQLMGDTTTTAEVRNYIREKIRAGMFLIKSINQRQQTIYNIAREIVKVQRDFFEQGISHLRPLTMNEIAQVVGIHETTVSRAIANKYIQTPRGTFEMKYFFTPGYKTASGQEISNKTIKDAISKLVAEEDPANPLSDQAMVETLQKMGIKVARRTIAKYREELRILPSHLRKQF